MKAWPRFALVAVCVLATRLGAAAEPRIARYMEYAAGDFTIVTSRGADQSRQFVQDLAKFRVTLEKTLGKRATRTVSPTTILITNGSDWNKYLHPAPERRGVLPAGALRQLHGDERRRAA